MRSLPARLPFFVLLAMLAGCADRPAAPPSTTAGSTDGAAVARRESDDGRGFVYDCTDAGLRFSAWVAEEEVGLWLPPDFDRPYERLEHLRSGSGARYGNDGVVLWIKGDEATLEVGDDVFGPCTVNHYESTWENAKLSGVHFRAVGNEPGWLMDIREPDEIALTLDYGERELVLDNPGPITEPDAGETVYRVATDSLDVTITIVAETCQDSMADHVFESTVTVRVGDRIYRGCGRALH